MYIGVGTGRCGSSSLSDWLGVYHELKPYPQLDWSEDQVRKHLKRAARLGGDVSFANLAILPFIKDEEVIVLMRDPEETIESILDFPNKDYFEKWYGGPLRTREQVGEYYDWYYATALSYNAIVIDPSQIPIRSNLGTH